MAQRTITADARALTVETEQENKPESLRVEFYGSISGTASAIRFGGMKDGARIQIDIPESEVVAALKVTALRGIPLKITIDVPTQEEVKTLFRNDNQ
jgi:hypothetical protein